MSKDLKSREFATTHKLAEHVVLDDSHAFTIPADLYNDIVLEGSGITVDQLKKKQKLEGELLAGVVLVAGEQAQDRFKANVELSEIGLNMPFGGSHTASVVFSRTGKDHVYAVVNNKVGNAEMKRVMSHLNSLFDDISN